MTPEQQRQQFKDDMAKYGISANAIVGKSGFTGFHKYLDGTDSSVKHVSAARVALCELIGQDLRRNTVELRGMTSKERTALLNKSNDLTDFIFKALGIRKEVE